MLKQHPLNTLEKNDPVDHYLLIKRIELRNTRTGSNFLSTELGDKTGSLNANVWEGFAEVASRGNVGDVVKVVGSVEEFQGALQIRVFSMKLATATDKVTPIDFLPLSRYDINDLKNEFNKKIKNISDVYLAKLLKQIFSGERFEQFCIAPAGKSWHHAYVHGLIEHTLEIIKICELMCEFHPDLNKDLLLTGAMLHDIGKTEELKYESAFEYTDKGKLIGHIVIAANLLTGKIKNIPGFPNELENNLLHLILSHQGKLEHASPVVPKTAEAIALYQADELSAKVNAYKTTIESEIRGDSKWTRYIPLADTDLYKNSITTESDNKSLFD